MTSARPGTAEPLRVLVTGATGFIGKALVARLAASPRYLVRAASRLGGTGPSHEVGNGPVEQILVGDLDAPVQWGAALDRVDVVVHLAGRAHVMDSRGRDPLAFRRINTDATLDLARHAAASARCPRFIFISSIGVNGTWTIDRAFTENDPPAPEEEYARSKLDAEIGLRQLSTDTGLAVTIIRPPLVYGGNAPGNFGRLTRILRQRIPLPLGAVGNLRSFVSVENLTDLIVTCMEHPAAANETFLVSDGEDLSTTALLQRMAGAMDRRAVLVPVPVSVLFAAAALLGQSREARRLLCSLQVDSTKARSLLGWTPPLTVNEGLRRAVSG